MGGPTDRDRRKGAWDDQTARLAGLYEKMSTVLRENLERAGMITEDTFERALDESRDWALKFKENHRDEIGRVAEFLRRDWQEGMRSTGERARKTLDPDRLHAGMLGLLLQFAHSAGGWLQAWAARLRERLTYRSGEIAGAGTLACNACGKQLRFERPTAIPVCPNCGGGAYTRGY